MTEDNDEVIHRLGEDVKKTKTLSKIDQPGNHLQTMLKSGDCEDSKHFGRNKICTELYLYYNYK